MCLAAIPSTGHAGERTPTYWSLTLGKPAATCTAVSLGHERLGTYFEERYGARCRTMDKGDHLLFTCGERVDAVLFSREVCKDWEQVRMSSDERKLATAFRVCMERAKTSFSRDDSVLYCDCAVHTARPGMASSDIAKASATCLQGLDSALVPRPDASPESTVEASLRTACIAGVGIARGTLPARPDGGELQSQAYTSCPTQLAKLKQEGGGFGEGRDLVGIACGLGIDAMYVGYGLGSETQGKTPTERVVQALAKCVADMSEQGITSERLQANPLVAIPVDPVVPASFGTCFAVSPDGLLVTARHIVAGRSEISVRFGGAKAPWKPAQLVKTSEGSDVALLRVSGAPPAYLSVAPTKKAALGLNVFTVGFPAPEILGDDMKFTEGTISALSGLQGEPSLFQISVPIQAGNSGGPIVTHSGEVLGIVNSTTSPEFFAERTGALPQNVNYALKSDLVLPLLPRLSGQKAAKSRQAAIDRAVKSVCAVRAAL